MAFEDIVRVNRFKDSYILRKWLFQNFPYQEHQILIIIFQHDIFQEPWGPMNVSRFRPRQWWLGVMLGMTMIASVSRVQCDMLCKMKIPSDRSEEHWWWTNFPNSPLTMAVPSGCWLVVTLVIKWLCQQVCHVTLPRLSLVHLGQWLLLIGWWLGVINSLSMTTFPSSFLAWQRSS